MLTGIFLMSSLSFSANNRLWFDEDIKIIKNEAYKYIVHPVEIEGASPTEYKLMRDKFETIRMDAVKIIGESAFSGQDELKTVQFSDVLREIQSNAFENSTQLKEIEFPQSLKIIGSAAFLNSGLKEVVIPGSVKKIQPLTFSGNDYLEKVILAEGVESIGANAFSTLRLREIHIPNSVIEIDPLALELNGLDHVILYTPSESVAAEYGKSNNMQIVFTDKNKTTNEDDIYQFIDGLEIVRSNAKKRVKEHINFIDLNPEIYPSGVYEVEVWNEDTTLSFSSAPDDEFALVTWYLIKKGDHFEPISMFDALPEAEYIRTDTKLTAIISAPSNITVTDKEGHVYTENSPELYGLICYYYSKNGTPTVLTPEVTVVKYSDIPKGNVGLNSAKMGFPIAAELHALEENEGMPPTLPITEEDFAQLFLYMTKNNIFEHRVHLINARFDVAITPEFKEKMANGFKLASHKYPEYMAYTHSYNYTTSGAGLGCYVTFSIQSDAYTFEEIKQMQLLFQLRTKGYLDALKKQGKFSDDMTQREKAKAIYEWVILFADYDLDYNKVSHTGFGLLDNKYAVCEGYAATYNMMCRLAGINIQGCVGEPKGNSEKNTHMWSLAELDGVRVHIDTTWGDPTNPSLPEDYIDYAYFALDSEVMKDDHSWDETIFGE